MFRLLSLCRVVIAPLETIFNRAKSHIKLLEASLTCTSTVYSTIPDMEQHTGEAPYYIRENADWLPQINRAWDEFDLSVNNRLREYFFRNYFTVNCVSRLLTFVEA